MGKHFYHCLCPYPSFSGYQILRYPWHVCRNSPFLSHIYHPETCNISCPLLHSGFDRGNVLDLLASTNPKMSVDEVWHWSIWQSSRKVRAEVLCILTQKHSRSFRQRKTPIKLEPDCWKAQADWKASARCTRSGGKRSWKMSLRTKSSGGVSIPAIVASHRFKNLLRSSTDSPVRTTPNMSSTR